jgi:hypothetical protein
MNTVETLTAGQDILTNHGRLHPELMRATLVEDFHPGDTYMKVNFNDARPYNKPLVLTHRNNLERILPSLPRDTQDRNLDPSNPMTDPTTKTVTKRVRKTRSPK